ncbi:permease-like cell division protein FtsX [Uliginosibacterium gangwonense]|uniref:permease-like cell division protein FtsX n=1 Tax=Uliginosibacterium gangwonense TaxID=392736 RepID=UPI000366E760|nr:permease-like cell division protein FtsX [Uliginosibacterium gangwonense]
MNNWFRSHLLALLEAALRLLSKPFGSFMSALVIAIALTLPALMYAVLDDFAGLAKGVSGKPEISIFLKKEIPSPDALRLQEILKKDARIASVRYIARDEALKQLAASGGFADVVGSLQENPLPDAFIIEPANSTPADFAELKTYFLKLPEVAQVQLDSAWVERLHAIVDLGRSAVLMLAGLLGAALMIIIFNTIRLQILTQRHEISVSLLVGATRAYVRRPFLYFGFLQGLMGGVFAWALVAWLMHLLSPRIQSLAQTYSIVLSLHGLLWWHVLALLGFAGMLGWLGASLSVHRHLHDRPFA